MSDHELFVLLDSPGMRVGRIEYVISQKGVSCLVDKEKQMKVNKSAMETAMAVMGVTEEALVELASTVSRVSHRVVKRRTGFQFNADRMREDEAAFRQVEAAKASRIGLEGMFSPQAVVVPLDTSCLSDRLQRRLAVV